MLYMVYTKMGNNFTRILSCQKYKLKSKVKVEQRAVGLSWSFRREKYFLIDIYNIKSQSKAAGAKANQKGEKFHGD